MDLVHSLSVLRNSPFWGRRRWESGRLKLRGLPKDRLSASPGVFARESETEYKRSRSSQDPGRKPTSRFERGSEAGGFVDDPGDSVAATGGVKPVKESPGERFLNRAFLSRTQKEEEVEKKGSTKSATKAKKKKEVSQMNLLNHNQPSCYGCGALLQTGEAEAPGYIPPQTFELKKKHHQLKAVLCGRCRLLSQGQMIPAVGGVGGYGSGKGYIPAEQLRAQLSHLRYQKALIVKLVDIVDFNGSFLGRVRDLVGANPIILVLTKVDLLPEGTDFTAVSDWLQEAVARKKLNVISIHLTSSKAKTGIARVAADITRQRLGRDVYILGSANVGKSAFVTALLQEMGRRDLVAAAALRFKPIQSAMPGTTLGPIEFEAFNGGGKLFDTPGVHLHHRMAASLDPHDVGLIAPRHRLRGYVVGPPVLKDEEPEEESLLDGIDLDAFFKEKTGGKNWWGTNTFTDIDEEHEQEEEKEDREEEEDEVQGSWTQVSLAGYTLFWGGIARIDVIKVPKDVKFTFYGPSAIRVLRVPTEEADEFYQESIGKELRPPSTSTLGSWAGLETVQDISLVAENLSKQPAGDLAISGLGWITIGKASVLDDPEEEDGMEGTSNTTAEEEQSEDGSELYSEDDEIEIVLHTPKAVEVFVRPSIPLGKAARKWYDYSDLTDADLEARPQVFY